MMASRKDEKFLEFCKERLREGMSYRAIAQERTESTGEKCTHKVVSAIAKEYGELNILADRYGVPVESIRGGFIKSDNLTLRFNKENKSVSYHEIKDDIINEMKNHSPKYPKIKREKIKEGHLLVIDPADIHIGKLCSPFETGDTYNVDIAISRVLEGIDGILQKASGFPIEKILFIGGNDILHIDNPRRTTTSGTPQDTDGMWYDNYKSAQRLMVKILERLLTVAPVEFLFCPSNHDFVSGFMLCDSLTAWFNRVDDITFNVDMSHRKYMRYGDNLIGVTHGDGAKVNDLPLLMAHECKDWSECKNRYIYSHHVHHKSSKDFIGVTFETLRSPSGTDSWHYRNGYTGVPKAIEGFIHHPKYGQICRLTHPFID